MEDTRLEAKAKDTKKFWGQGQGQRRQCSPKKKGPQNFFQAKKVFKNFFSGDLRKPKKRPADFPQGFWRFPTKFQRFKNSAVLEPKTGQFSRTWGFDAKAKDFKMCPRGQGRPQGLHLYNRVLHFVAIALIAAPINCIIVSKPALLSNLPILFITVTLLSTWRNNDIQS